MQTGLVAESQLEILAWGYVQIHGLRVVVVKMPITNGGDDAFLPRYRFRTRALSLCGLTGRLPGSTMISPLSALDCSQ